MAQLYPIKFIAAQGKHIDNGEYTENFKGWTNELAHFDTKAWRRAYTRIEHDIKKAAQDGVESWPPSSLAVVAYAEPGIGERSFKAFDRTYAIEDLTKKEERFETGKKQCEDLLSFWK